MGSERVGGVEMGKPYLAEPEGDCISLIQVVQIPLQ